MSEYAARGRFLRAGRVLCLVALLGGMLLAAFPVSAQSVADYFSISYDPVVFSTSEVQGSAAFTATMSGRATCSNDLPVSVSEAIITARVVAESVSGGAKVVLNPNYTTTIKPFPSKKGETADIKQTINLQFPAGTQSGDYNVVGEIVEGKIKVSVANLDVTQYLPQRQPMGKVKYISGEAAAKPTPEPVPSATQVPKPTSPPSPQKEPYVPVWAWLVVGIAVLTTIFNIVWYARHRAR